MNYAEEPRQGVSAVPPRVAICGSFRRDLEALRREYQEFREMGCTVLSPADLDFVAEIDGFVLGKGDAGKSTAQIEELHLQAMQQADLVWLHCPQGYVGSSAAMELGFARAVGLRVFSVERPQDVTLADLVQLCSSPRAAVDSVQENLGEAPSNAFPGLQRYYARTAERRGWADESVSETIDRLKGEIGELEEELVIAPDRDATLLELADIQLYVIHLANVLGANLGEAVRAKERINAARFERDSERLAA
jgi:NTP pyrophosphatase (non-canonical NTP hydrolase)